MVSGALAASAWADGMPQRYDRLWKLRLQGLLRAGLVNRFLYERMGDAGYTRYIPHVARHADGRAFLGKHYGPAWWKSLLFHAVRPAMARRIAAPTIMEPGCDCTFCRCSRLAVEATPYAA
jgi:flavin-dependent dehydrogenase